MMRCDVVRSFHWPIIYHNACKRVIAFDHFYSIDDSSEFIISIRMATEVGLFAPFSLFCDLTSYQSEIRECAYTTTTCKETYAFLLYFAFFFFLKVK